MEGNIAEDRARNSSWREAHCAGGYPGRTVAVGNPHWSRDTPKGTAAHEGPGLQQKSKKEGGGEEKSKRSETAARNITYQPKLLHCPFPHSRDWQGLSVMCGQNRGRGDSEEKCRHEAESGEGAGKGFPLVFVSLFFFFVSQ